MANRFDKLDKMTDGPTAYFIGGKEVKQENLHPITLSEKPHSKQEKLVYSLLEQYCDFIMCENEEDEEDYLFYSKEQFNIFAKDKGGGVYGFIGGIGNIKDENVPIAYVSTDGQSGKLSNNLKELLSLINFYPFWMDLLKLLKHYDGDIQKIIELCIKERVEDMPNFYEIQQTIADNLGIKRQDCFIENLFNCLSEEPKFIVYSTNGNNPSENLLI